MKVSSPTMPSKAPPRFLGVLIGEIVQNLRTSLDYLIHRLAWYDAGPDAERKTQFPIEDKPEVFKGRKRTHLEGLTADHIAAIERLQPYNGVKWLAALRDLFNGDKHSVLQVGASIMSSA